MKLERPAPGTGKTKKATTAFGKIDVLVNCAGIGILEKLEEYTEKVWDMTMAVNLTGSTRMALAVGETMKKNGELTEDDQKDAEKKIQKLTDKYCDEVDKAVAEKEKEIMII